MSDHFIRNIEIKNYKLFHEFKAEGFGRVNLIGGKNNVGKTAFMEACYLSQSVNTSDLFGRLLEIKTHRDLVNILLSSKSREDYLRSLINESIGIEIKLKGKGGEEFTEEKDSSGNIVYQDYKSWKNGLIKIEQDTKLNIYTKFSRINVEPPFEFKGEIVNPSYPDQYFISDLIKMLDTTFDSTKKRFSKNYISPYSNSNQELEELIGQSKLDEKYDLLNKYLDETFGVTSIDIIKNKPMLRANGKYIELSQFGQGIKSFINYIGSLSLLQNTQLFIDEIENGIHYTNFDKLWEIILTISREQNVQVFATTHSKECIESYARVAKKLDDEEIRFISLYKDDDYAVKSIVFDRHKIETRLELGLDNR